MNKSIKFLLGDDHNIVRQGLQLIIGDVVENSEIIHASSLEQILSQIKSTSFDIAILDAQFPMEIRFQLSRK